MREGQGAKAGTGAAFVSALATAATAATQVARMVEANETTARVARRARDRMLENRRSLLWLLLGVLGLGMILGLVMAKRDKKAGEPDEPAPASTKPEAVPETEGPIRRRTPTSPSV